MHTYIQTYIHISVYIYIYLFIYPCIYICMYTHTYIHKCMHTYMHTYIRTYIHTYVHTYIHTHTYIFVCVYRRKVKIEGWRYGSSKTATACHVQHLGLRLQPVPLSYRSILQPAILQDFWFCSSVNSKVSSWLVARGVSEQCDLSDELPGPVAPVMARSVSCLQP